LLETGFLAIFLCPLLDGPSFPKRAPPLVMLWLFRWLVFRIMLGAALIKLRGDTVWRDLTALYYHFESIASIKRSTAYAHKARYKDWLPLISSFENAERGRQKDTSQVFIRYRRAVDGIRFT